MRRAARAPLVPLRQRADRLRHSLPAFRAALLTAWGPTPRPAPGRLRVGVDIRPFYEPLTGVGWYLFFLLEELVRRDDLEIVCFGEPVVDDGGPRLHVEIPGRLEPVGFDFRGLSPTAGARRMARGLWPALVLRQRCDLFFGANYFLPRSLSVLARRRVVTVHDLTWRRYPELLQQETLANLERSMLREISRADAVVCVSEATRRDLLELYPIDPRRAFAVLSGPPPARPASTLSLDLPERYLLFVGTIEPRKNLGDLVSAFERMKDRGYPGQLVVAGKVGWKAEGIVARLETSRWASSIRRLDYVERDQLPHLYRNAEIFVLPSLYEGFGFPVLEAMGEGTPVVTARNSSLPEVGGTAAQYFSAGDPEELAQRMMEIVADPERKRRMREGGLENLGRFSWRRAADETAAVFRRVGR